MDPEHNRITHHCGTDEPSPATIAELASARFAFAANNKNAFVRTVRQSNTVEISWIHFTNGSEGRVSAQQRANQIMVLNEAYKGSNITFSEKSSRDVDNAEYFNMQHKSPIAPIAKRATKDEDQYVLTVWTCNCSVLGWATFPWDRLASPDIDGVVVRYDTLPGGVFAPYNEGKTLIHEVGHWFGLFHTFQNGCSGLGDQVSDTPAHATPNYGTPDPSQRNGACNSREKAPVKNFMNYTDDNWMDHFTSAQDLRINQYFLMYRARPIDAGVRVASVLKRTRKALSELTVAEWTELYTAFHLIQESGAYFEIAKIHGGEANFAEYCHHGTVLFPSWHRAYLQRMEEALALAVNNDKFALPYWDASSAESLANGLPQQLLDFNVRIQDGSEIPNPLRSYRFRQAHSVGRTTIQIGDQTGRGGTDESLRERLVRRLPSVALDIGDALIAPTFEEFSCTSLGPESLEDPHNTLHGLLGGRGSPLTAAMGFVETAAFDPVFWFHHCNMDRLFHIWQTTPNNSASWTPRQIEGFLANSRGLPTGSLLAKDSHLAPFKFSGDINSSHELVENLGDTDVTYSQGSTPSPRPDVRRVPGGARMAPGDSVLVTVSGFDRFTIKGPAAVTLTPGIGNHTMFKFLFARLDAAGCTNCKLNNQVDVSFVVPVDQFDPANMKLDVLRAQDAEPVDLSELHVTITVQKLFRRPVQEPVGGPVPLAIGTRVSSPSKGEGIVTGELHPGHVRVLFRSGEAEVRKSDLIEAPEKGKDDKGK